MLYNIPWKWYEYDMNLYECYLNMIIYMAKIWFKYDMNTIKSDMNMM